MLNNQTVYQNQNQNQNKDDSSVNAIVAKAVWLQKLDLPVDLEDLQPIPEPIRSSFGIKPDSMFKSSTTINTKGVGPNTPNHSKLQRDGKALVCKKRP